MVLVGLDEGLHCMDVGLEAVVAVARRAVAGPGQVRRARSQAVGQQGTRGGPQFIAQPPSPCTITAGAGPVRTGWCGHRQGISLGSDRSPRGPPSYGAATPRSPAAITTSGPQARSRPGASQTACPMHSSSTSRPPIDVTQGRDSLQASVQRRKTGPYHRGAYVVPDGAHARERLGPPLGHHRDLDEHDARSQSRAPPRRSTSNLRLVADALLDGAQCPCATARSRSTSGWRRPARDRRTSRRARPGSPPASTVRSADDSCRRSIRSPLPRADGSVTSRMPSDSMSVPGLILVMALTVSPSLIAKSPSPAGSHNVVPLLAPKRQRGRRMVARPAQRPGSSPR